MLTEEFYRNLKIFSNTSTGDKLTEDRNIVKNNNNYNNKIINKNKKYNEANLNSKVNTKRL